ncbi:MAG: hypothetical protein H7327_03155 [Herminiimonas sp.]|nr:hypothetical protein [Herminiimonas sp.]
MDFNINNFDLFMVAAGVMSYAIGAAIWTCLEMPTRLLRAPALDRGTAITYNLENRNEFL